MPKIKIEQRKPEKMQQMHAELVGFLKSHPDYQWVETSDGIQVVISPLEYKLDTGIVAEKGAKLSDKQ